MHTACHSTEDASRGKASCLTRPLLTNPAVDAMAKGKRTRSPDGECPAKRRRTSGSTAKLLRGVHKFIHVEAGGVRDDDEDDEYETDDGELDDGELDDGDMSAHPDILMANAPDDLEHLEAVARLYEERAREERSQWAREEHIMPSADVLARGPVYAVGVPTGTELDLLAHLLGEDQHGRCLARGRGVNSAFTHALGSGRVYVELNDVACAREALAAYPGLWRQKQIPKRIPGMEAFLSLNLPSAAPYIGRFWRLTKRHGELLPGDLVFAHSERQFLGIPRVAYPQEPRPPPQALFDADKFKRLHEDVTLEERNGIHILNGMVYLSSGLVECDWKGDNWRATVATAHAMPTEAEWALFAAANDANLESTPVFGPTCALQAGDRVVVVSGEHKSETGRVLAVFDREGAYKNGCKAVVRWAVIQTEDGGRMDDAADIMVPVSRVLRHVLSTPRPIEVGARVTIVDGTRCRGQSGTLEGRTEHGACEVRLADGGREVVQVHLRDIQLELSIGDAVRIRRGPRAGTVGFVAGTLGRAETEFLPCDPGRSRRCLAALQARTGCVQSSSNDATYRVPVADLEPLDELAYAAAPGARPTRPNDVSKEVKAEMWTGKGYDGMEVQIVRRHGRKACFGTVVGYVEAVGPAPPYDSIEFKRDENGKLRRRWLKTDGGVKLRIQIEMGSEMVDATMDQVIHRFTGLPLWRHRLLEAIGGTGAGDEDKPVEQPRAPVAASPPPPTATVDVVGDTTGEWLTRPQLVGKRVDVRVENVKASRYRKAVTKRALLREGREGFLVPLLKPIVMRDLRNGVWARLKPFSEHCPIPADALRPLRITSRGRSIADDKSRVIIIGPDVDGSLDRVGLYAETIPGGVGPVKVRFPLEWQGGSLKTPVGWFDLSSMCRAENQPLEFPEIRLDATDFDAEPPEL
ncbi:hypothetical protein C8R45DRAFT_276081 [Mycena sanguinolenta]|nr:hypothetical protein C8R45DRAFT_276081 [Mycena sanguinolenta]